MAMKDLSIKRLQIDKANTTVLTVVAVAAFIVIFCLVASHALLDKRAYQGRVIAKKEKALKQLQDNLKASDSLVSSYQQFINTSTNVIGGNPAGQGDRDGDNAKIILDALPSKYDFPALATSLEKILRQQNYKIESISGTDDELAQQSNSSSPTPSPVDMPFRISVSGTYIAMQNLINVFESSIRPFQIQTLELSGNNNDMHVNINAKTFYQPQKSLKITTEVVK